MCIVYDKNKIAVVLFYLKLRSTAMLLLCPSESHGSYRFWPNTNYPVL